MIYLDDETLAWAKATREGETDDINGATLEAGDNFTPTKDLIIKSVTLAAKRGFQLS